MYPGLYPVTPLREAMYPGLYLSGVHNGGYIQGVVGGHNGGYTQGV